MPSQTLLRGSKFAAISTSSAGDNQLVAAVAGCKIRVVSGFLIADSTPVSVQFRSNANGTACTGLIPLAANAGFVLPYNQGGWFETDVGEYLNLELSGSVAVGGAVSYVEIRTRES